jgi:hypothetical protein
VRDGARHLPEAVASLQAQTDPDFEVLAVDDGSADDTYGILAAWAWSDRRVRPLRQEPGGIVVALERARAMARGRWLARMDADDVSEPERFARQRALMESDPTLAVCGTHVRSFPRAEVRAGARRYEAWLNATAEPDEVARDLFVECPLAHPTFFLSADAVASVGGYRDRGWAEDYDLLLRLWRAGGRLAKVPEVLLRWREGAQRLQRTSPVYAADAFVRCKVHHLTRSLLADGRGVAVWGAGPVGKTFARALIDAGATVRAFVEVDPRKIGQEIHGAPVFATAEGLALGGVLHLAAVGQPGARDTLRGILAGAGLRELVDYVAVA